MTSLLKELLRKRGLALEENQEDKAPEGAEVSTGTEQGAAPETPTASPDVVDDTAIHGEPGTNDNQAAGAAEGGTADPETPASQTDEIGTQGQDDGGAAGASEDGGLGEPQVNEDDIQGEAVEADEVEQADVDEAEEAVEEAEEVTATMESLIERIKDSVAGRGLTAREAALAQTRASNVLKRLGIAPVLFPSKESFETTGERIENTRLVIGALLKSTTEARELKAGFIAVRDDRKARLAKK